MRPWEVGRLTPRQLVEFYCRKRDKQGVPDPMPYPFAKDERKEAVQFLMVMNKFTRAQAEQHVYGRVLGD